MEKIHAVVVVDDDGRNEGLSTSRTNFIYQLTHPITFYKRSVDKQYFARIENVRIPISFYAVNDNYNVFSFDDGGTDYFFTLTNGNYTIDELIAEVQTQMNATASLTTYTLTYDEITQKVNIASDGAGGITTITADDGAGNTNTLYKLLGFELAQTIADGGNSDGNNVAYTNTARYLKLYIDNINSNNVYSNSVVVNGGNDKTTNVQKIGLMIPITETRNEFEFFDNHDGYKIKMPNVPSITEFRVKLLDRFNNDIDLNSAPWGFDVVFYEVNKNPWKNQ